jgi:hypothetical protein
MATRTFLVSYATRRFEKVRQDLNISAQRFGLDNILSYAEADLWKSEFYRNNKSLLDEPCGAGYWVWKPYFILEAMNVLNDGDILYYCDAGSRFISSPEPLSKICLENASGIVLFDARPLTNRQFTKRECFVRMECDEPACWSAPKVIATMLVLKKRAFVLDFLRAWLAYCQVRDIVAHGSPVAGGPKELEGFLGHRWDQSILSLMAFKYSLETYRNPTVWGNYLKPAVYRQWREKICSPYDIPPHLDSYAEAPQKNSPYGTLFEINRLPNHDGKPPVELPDESKLGLLSRQIKSNLKRYTGFR